MLSEEEFRAKKAAEKAARKAAADQEAAIATAAAKAERRARQDAERKVKEAELLTKRAALVAEQEAEAERIRVAEVERRAVEAAEAAKKKKEIEAKIAQEQREQAEAAKAKAKEEALAKEKERQAAMLKERRIAEQRRIVEAAAEESSKMDTAALMNRADNARSGVDALVNDRKGPGLRSFDYDAAISKKTGGIKRLIARLTDEDLRYGALIDLYAFVRNLLREGGVDRLSEEINSEACKEVRTAIGSVGNILGASPGNIYCLLLLASFKCCGGDAAVEVSKIRHLPGSPNELIGTAIGCHLFFEYVKFRASPAASMSAPGEWSLPWENVKKASGRMMNNAPRECERAAVVAVTELVKDIGINYFGTVDTDIDAILSKYSVAAARWSSISDSIGDDLKTLGEEEAKAVAFVQKLGSEARAKITAEQEAAQAQQDVVEKKKAYDEALTALEASKKASDEAEREADRLKLKVEEMVIAKAKIEALQAQTDLALQLSLSAGNDT